MRHNAEIIEPSFGLIHAVADDEVVATQGLVAHIESRSCVVSCSNGVAKNDMVLSVADADDALTHIIMEVHVDGLSPIARFDVRIMRSVGSGFLLHEAVIKVANKMAINDKYLVFMFL